MGNLKPVWAVERNGGPANRNTMPTEEVNFLLVRRTDSHAVSSAEGRARRCPWGEANQDGEAAP